MKWRACSSRAAVGVKNGAGGQLDNLNADNNGGINGRLLSIANT